MCTTNNETDSKISNEKTAHLLEKKNQSEDEYRDLPPPPDGGYGWVIVAASFICNMIGDGIAYTFGIFLSEIVSEYGESKGKTAWVGSLFPGMCMCVGPIVSVLTNKYGCRTVCIAGSIISAVAFAVSTYSPSVNWLMLTYGFIGGVGFGLIYLPAVVCVGYYFESKRSLATGIAVCGSGVGTFVFAPLASLLLELYGWKGANLVFSGLFLTCVICGAVMRPLKYSTESKVVDNVPESKFNVIGSVKSLNKAPKLLSEGTITISIPDMRRNHSTHSFLHRNITEVESLRASKLSLSSNRMGNVIQPLSRKDVFYSGSLANLKEFQSQKLLSVYRHSVLSIPHVKNFDDKQTSENEYLCLLKDPVFLLIGVSNLFGMAALYVPFVYLVDCAMKDGVDSGSASFLISIIGITNTAGRIVCGYFADYPQVNSLLVNNICLSGAALSLAVIPFCHTHTAYIVIAISFGIAISGYISLTSIILVDLLGLDKLTSAFGLLILFRGAAAFVGTPLAGALYDATQSYDMTFYAAGALFAISALVSFMVPCMKTFLPKAKETCITEVLSPINENVADEININ